MKKTALWTAVILFFGHSLAVAQEAPYSQTLDEQLMRVRSGKPAVPMISAQPQPAAQPAAQAAMAPAAGEPMPAAAPAVPVAPNGEMIYSQGGGAIPPLPLQMERAASGVVYLSGGIGDEELAQLKMVENDFNVQMLMASKSGEYLAGVTVRILDASGNPLVFAQYAGPYLYVKLEPGSYKIEATNVRGIMETSSLKVPASGTIKPTVRFAD